MFLPFKYFCSLLIILYIPPIYAGFLTEVDNGLVTFSHSPHEDIIIVEGEVAEFNCSAIGKDGQSLAITWLKDGKELINRNNTTLSIANVSLVDEGVYSCIAQLDEGRVLTGNVQITLATAPELLVEPVRTTAYVHHPTRLTCAALAVPSPTYLWMKNGNIIHSTDDKRIVLLESGPLQILNVDLEDAGDYKCIAVNHMGNATSSVAPLTVLTQEVFDNDKVVSVIVGPENVSVVEGEDAFFECLFDAPSTIQFDWKRIGAIMSDRAEYVASNLLIRDVQMWDEGTYACMTKHEPSGKTIQWKAELSVFDVPKFFERPQDISARRGATARFRCYVEGQPIPQISWLYNGKSIKVGGRVKMFPPANKPPIHMDVPLMRTYKRDLVISSVQPEDVGIYQCVVSNSVTTISAAAALTFNGPLIGDGPRDLQVLMSQTEKTMKINWRPPKDMDVDAYIIHFYKTTNGRENTHSSMDSCDNGICRSDCCPAEELEPHTNYTFYVSGFTYSGGKFSAPSDSVVALTWDDYAKNVAPLTVTGLTDSSVRLQWKPPAADKVPGTIKEYKLEYSGNGIERTKQFPHHVTDYILLGLEPESNYKFRVLVSTGAGYPPELLLKGGLRYPWIQFKLGRNGDAQPLMAPTLKTVVVNSTTVNVLWTPHGDILPAGYAVIYHLLSPTNDKPSSPHVLKTSKDARAILISGLAPYSLYEISVSAISESGKAGARSTQAIRTLPAPTPPDGEDIMRHLVEPPHDIQCQPVSPSKLVIRWLPPPSKRTIVGYTVKYHLVFEDHHTKPDIVLPEEIADTKVAAFEAAMLSPGRTYSFAVRSRDKYGYEGPYSVEFPCHTPLSGAAPGAVKDVHLSFINKSSVLVQWNPPSNYTVVLSYIIEYTLDDPNTSSWRKVIVNGTRTNTVIGDLEEGVIFFVRLSARSVDGVGPSTHIFSSSWTSSQSSGLVGALIGVVVTLLLLLFLIMCCCKTRYHPHLCCFYARAEDNRIDQNKPNGHVLNGRVPSAAPLSEVQELQTLLPPLMENMECDAKGGDDGTRPRSSHIISVPSVNRLQSNISTSLLRSQQKEDLPVSVDVVDDCICSESSHSPAATASSLHSWSVHEDHSSTSSKHSCSLPNLADSGIGFDESHCHQDLSPPCSHLHNSPKLKGACSSGEPQSWFVTSNQHSPAEVVRIPSPRTLSIIA